VVYAYEFWDALSTLLALNGKLLPREIIPWQWHANDRSVLPTVHLLPRDATHSAIVAVARSLSVCPSVILVYCLETAKVIIRFFSRPDNQSLQIVAHQTIKKTTTGTSQRGRYIYGMGIIAVTANISLYHGNVTK